MPSVADVNKATAAREAIVDLLTSAARNGVHVNGMPGMSSADIGVHLRAGYGIDISNKLVYIRLCELLDARVLRVAANPGHAWQLVYRKGDT